MGIISLPNVEDLLHTPLVLSKVHITIISLFWSHNLLFLDKKRKEVFSDHPGKQLNKNYMSHFLTNMLNIPNISNTIITNQLEIQ